MNKATFKVSAAQGLKVPYETKPRKHITDSCKVQVPASAYYLRRIASGELVDIEAAAAEIAAQREKAKSTKGAQ